MKNPWPNGPGSTTVIDGINIEAGQHLVAISVGLHLGRIEGELFAPDQVSLLKLLYDVVEAAAEDGDVIPFADIRQAGMVRRCNRRTQET